MAADPLGPGLCLVLLFFFAALVRCAGEAVRYLDEDSFRGDDARIRRLASLEALAEGSFSPVHMTHVFLLLASVALSELWISPRVAVSLFAVLPIGAGATLAFILVLVASSLVLFTLATLVPGAAAASAPEAAFAMASLPSLILVRILTPVTWLSRQVAGLLLKPFGLRLNAQRESVTEEEIRAMVDIGEERGAIESDEKQMIENIFEFNNLDAEDCMVHRKDIIAIDIEDTPEEILKIIEESGLSRFPVYEDDIDSVIGILTSRDYLINACKGSPKTLRELIRPAHFVPESVHSDVLFSEMQARKQHIAIVVDEYGGTSGLVTLEDLLEEIVGNIYDEFDPKEEQDITPLGGGKLRCSGQTDLETLFAALGRECPEEDEFDTLGGLIYSQLTEIPADGDRPVVECMGLKIQVEEILDRRVEWAIVEPLPEAPARESH